MRLDPANGARRSAAGVLVALLALAAVGFAARLMPWRTVFTSDGVELLPADSHYYVRFAKLQLDAFPRFTQVDPWVNFPAQPRIIWPPLHAELVAAAVALAGRDHAEAGAAWVDPVLALAWLVGLGALARRLRGPKFALWLVAVLAFAPTAIESGALGNADHHVHEAFWQALWVLLLGEALRARSTRYAIAAGLALGLGRSLTTVGFLGCPLAAGVLLLAALRTRDPQLGRLTALTGSTATLVLTLCAALLGNLGLLDYELLGAFPALLTFAAFGIAAGIAGAVGGARKWLAVLGLSLLPLALLGSQLLRAIQHLGVRDPLLVLIDESQPLWRNPRWALELIGPLVVILPLALLRLRRPAADGAPRLERWPALLSLALMTALAALQARFIQSWVGAAAVVVAFGFEGWTFAPERRRAGVALVAGLSLLWVGSRLRPAPAEVSLAARLKPTLFWIRDHTPSTGDVAVLGNYLFGHWIVLWAQRPAVASTFSQLPWHVDANRRASEILAAEDEEVAYGLCGASRVGYVLATPFEALIGFPDAPRRPGLLRRMMEQLPPVFGHFRLLHESTERRKPPGVGPLARVYQVVPGARVEGPCAGEVTLSTSATVDGAKVELAGKTPCDVDGRFLVRLAQPGTWTINGATVEISDEAVLTGVAAAPAPDPSP